MPGALQFEAVATLISPVDAADLAILLFYPACAPEAWQLNAIPLTEGWITRGANLVRGVTLAVAGFPGERRHIDYDKREVVNRRHIFRARYCGADDARSQIHTCQVLDDLELTSFGRLGGSPVFTSSSAGIGLAGLVIQGHPTRQTLHFISSRVLWHALGVIYSKVLGPAD
ncbi:MAG: hypothetical protein IPK12_07165 [Gemmatimonadetes bacterium]|nr:hypothetical protein [Gemmatimonadota bacterium]